MWGFESPPRHTLSGTRSLSRLSVANVGKSPPLGTNEIAAEFGVHTTQTCPAARRIGHWKKQVLESLPEIFANNRGRSRDEDEALRARLYQQN